MAQRYLLYEKNKRTTNLCYPPANLYNGIPTKGVNTRQRPKYSKHTFHLKSAGLTNIGIVISAAIMFNKAQIIVLSF